jgi:hypothetical protein
MARAFCVLIVGCLILGVASDRAIADSKSGEIKFTAPKKESVKVALGDKVKLDAELKMIEVGNLAAVSVAAKVKNTANVMMHYSYNVAFLDKDKNLIGCQNFNLSIAANQGGTAGTFIQLPRDEIARIAYYSVAFHESDMPIGTK